MIDTSAWRGFPMGPRVREFLGFSQADVAADTQMTDASFDDFFLSFAHERGIPSPDVLSDLLDELVAMDKPRAALGLAAAFADTLPKNDFRTELAIGIAAMLSSSLDEAEARLRKAQELMPEEPAPYVNLAQIFMVQGRRDDAEVWTLAGLDAEPNNFALWDLLGELYRDLHGEFAPDELLAVAVKRGAWAGLALSANLTTTGDRYFKLSLLEKPYHQGERDPEFLVELTAAMGVAGEFDRIPPIVWQAERSASTKLPWQLYVHCAQAQLAMNKPREAREAIAKVRVVETLPIEVREAVAVLINEADELEAQQSSQVT